MGTIYRKKSRMDNPETRITLGIIYRKKSRMDNPETLITPGTQDTARK